VTSEQVEEIDPDGISAEQFAALIAHAESDDQIAEGLRMVGTEAVLDRIFDVMGERLRPERAEGVEAEIEWVVVDASQEHTYVTRIEGGACEVEKAEAVAPRVTLKTDLATFAKLITGQAGGPQLFMKGRLRVSGDIWFAQRITGLFEMPRSG
jgi:putative sterol carrier protein